MRVHLADLAYRRFQSQTRSRSTCDAEPFLIISIQPACFNLRREAAPHATTSRTPLGYGNAPVSISDEKPLHMRLPSSFLLECLVSCFNLRREAAPHATQHLLGLRWSFSVVSISDEKPLHMRLLIERSYTMQLTEFQSQTRSRSTCDVKSTLMSRSPK